MTQALPVDTLLLAEVFDKVPSAIIVLDEQGCVKRANQSASKLLGLDSLEHERWVELVSKVFRPRQDDGHEISTIDGRRLQVITMDLQQGQLIQMTDLTQTRALQDKIAHMERLSSLGKMAASLAHQIRTPLSAAMLYAANLGNANLQPMARKRFQEKLMGRLEALEAQVSDILMFARSNEQTVTEIDASALVDQTANNVSAVLAKGDAELETIADTGEMPILGNSTALIGALSNLVANAVEAGASKIILKLTKDDDLNTITFSVANNGPVIPEEIKQKIFEPFFTSKSSGTGLGLAVVTAVTKVHQGTLKLESWNSDYATVFSITIPLYSGNHLESSSLVNTVSSLRINQDHQEAASENNASNDVLEESAESVQNSSFRAQNTSLEQGVASGFNGPIGRGTVETPDFEKHEEVSIEPVSPTLGTIPSISGPVLNSPYPVSGDSHIDDAAAYEQSSYENEAYAKSDYAPSREFVNSRRDFVSGDAAYASTDKVQVSMSSVATSVISTVSSAVKPTSKVSSNSNDAKSPLNRGQIGAANAVLVAAVQKPK